MVPVVTSLRRLSRDQSGYTLVELVTLMGILALLSGLLLANTATGSKRQQVRDAAFGYVNAARRAESMAASSQTVGGTPRKAYGVCITSSEISGSRCTAPGGGQRRDTYQVYARQLSDTDYTRAPASPDIITTFQTDSSGVTRFTDASTYLDYLPPGPTLKVNGQPSTASPACPPTVTVDLTGRNYTKTVSIKACAGAVYVSN